MQSIHSSEQFSYIMSQCVLVRRCLICVCFFHDICLLKRTFLGKMLALSTFIFLTKLICVRRVKEWYLNSKLNIIARSPDEKKRSRLVIFGLTWASPSCQVHCYQIFSCILNKWLKFFQWVFSSPTEIPLYYNTELNFHFIHSQFDVINSHTCAIVIRNGSPEHR